MKKTGTRREKYPDKRSWATPELTEKLREVGALEHFRKECKRQAGTYKWNNDLSKAFDFIETELGTSYWYTVAASIKKK